MSQQVLTLSYRPRRLSEIVGQEKLIKQIRGHFLQKRIPQAWMFVGQTGGGKTTLARVVARLIQCRHRSENGMDVCDDCVKKWKSLDITTIPANIISGVDAMKSAISGANYEPRPGSLARVYILDELHRASEPAQEALLTPMEFGPKSTYYVICTTETDDIIPTIQSRCIKYTVPGLDEKSVRVLVKRGLRKIESELDPDSLSDQLLEQGISSPRLILASVEKYAAGAKPEEAALVEVSTELDTHAICRSVVGGVWDKVARQLMEAKPEDADAIRRRVAAYMREILLGETEYTNRTSIVADAIKELGSSYAYETSMKLSVLTATLYKLSKMFSQYKR